MSNESIIQTIQYKTNNQKLQLHYHDDYEILFITEGVVEIFINNKKFRAQKGDVIFLNCFELHHTNIIQTPYKRYAITLSRQILEKTFFNDIDLLSVFKKSLDTYDRCIHFDNFENIKEHLDKIIAETKMDILDKYSEELCIMYIKELLINAFRKQPKIISFENDHSSILKLVFNLQHYIDEHYSENIKITDICKKSLVSPPYFSHCFKTIVGISPKQYLMQLRLNSAANRIAFSSDKIIDIAFSAGFTDINNFTRKFKAHFNKTPLE